MRKTNRESFAINLKYYRYIANMSQSEFAAEIDIDLKYECQLENGLKNVSFDELDKISQNLSKFFKKDIPCSELITYYPERIINSKRIQKSNK